MMEPLINDLVLLGAGALAVCATAGLSFLTLRLVVQGIAHKMNPPSGKP